MWLHATPSRKAKGIRAGSFVLKAPIYASKVMLVCEKCNKATRISYKILPDGKKVRVCKKCAAELG